MCINCASFKLMRVDFNDAVCSVVAVLYRIIEKWLFGVFRLIISIIKTGSYQKRARLSRFAACTFRSDVILLSRGSNGTKITRINARMCKYMYTYACICHLVLNAEKCSVRTTGKVLHVSQGAPVHVELIDSQRRRRQRRRRETTMTATGTRTCHGHTLALGSCAYAYGEALVYVYEGRFCDPMLRGMRGGGKRTAAWWNSNVMRMSREFLLYLCATRRKHGAYIEF